MALTWTPELDCALTNLCNQNLSNRKVARTLRLSHYLVGKRREALGLPARVPKAKQFHPPVLWSPEMDAALLDLRAKGYGYYEAGEIIGVSNMAVKNRVKKLGLPTWSRGGGRKRARSSHDKDHQPRIISWTPTMDATLIKLRGEGLGYHPIGERLGMSYLPVRKRVQALGLPEWDQKAWNRRFRLTDSERVSQ